MLDDRCKFHADIPAMLCIYYSLHLEIRAYIDIRQVECNSLVVDRNYVYIMEHHRGRPAILEDILCRLVHRTCILKSDFA